MIPEEQNPKIHHMTVKAARTALAHRLISQDSYRAVLRGELSLVDAKALGPTGVRARPRSRRSRSRHRRLLRACAGAVNGPSLRAAASSRVTTTVSMGS
jgi:hypothetical protein